MRSVIKASIPNFPLSVDASIYRIDWKNIQLTAATPNGLGYISNGSRAKSQGIELEMQSKPLHGLTVNAWVTWNLAELTEDLPPVANVIGYAGDPLPDSPRFSAISPWSRNSH